MWPGVEPVRRAAELHLLEEVDGPFACLTPSQIAMQNEGFAHLPFDSVERVQARHGLLKYHGDAVAADRLQATGGSAEQLLAVETDAPGGMCGRRIRQ